ncbi:dodecin domain-containing protein [Nitrogeniibacter mangrovi]|uniref:Dodecin domain-containing protein n=1 Tax=Nitrogeniibacter mangrovi TaxID=2016596 RepID=A0A6C1AZ94_9RHOO|nr:dodecin family protein [Nitrogeniibacter mangrovi]QID16691.1 dodecin domain-containing protein [Nitrogeniibacter mangrovi]
MPEAQVTEVVAESAQSFEDAIRTAMAQARARLTNVCGAWVRRQRRVVSGGLVAYQVAVQVAFMPV